MVKWVLTRVVKTIQCGNDKSFLNKCYKENSTEFCQENALVIANALFQQHKMVNIEMRLIIFFAAKDGEALYSQQKQDRELTVAYIMNSL